MSWSHFTQPATHQSHAVLLSRRMALLLRSPADVGTMADGAALAGSIRKDDLHDEVNPCVTKHHVSSSP